MEQLLAELNRRGVKLRLEGEELRVSAPAGALTGELRQALKLNKEQILHLLRSTGARVEEALPQVEPDLDGRHEPFPLTDLQHAYWLGRDSGMEMGDVATHLYVELDCEGLEVERLNDALCRLIDRHDMLRAVVGGDGTQRILPTVPRYRIAVEDRSAACPEEGERAVLAARGALSHQVLRADRWPLFEVRATLLPAGRLRLHVSLDLLILDAWSIFLFFREWSRLYEDPDAALPGVGISFRDYVLAEKRLEDTEAYRRAHAYWMERVDTLPPAPELPIRPDPAARRAPRFSRREARLESARWQPLRARAREHGLTPSGLLLALYSEVLARWSATPHFTLNVTVSNRLPVHPDVNNLLGDFTSVVMQEVDGRDRGRTLLEFACDLQRQFITDLEHREVSGVAIMREWARRRGLSRQATMPVVFSSGLIWSGDDEVGDLEQFGTKVHSISQTSQVWLDHHVMELQGDLVFIWDAADAVFEPGVLDAMFASYCDLIDRLAADDSLWDSRDPVALPAEMQRRRVDANRTADVVPRRRLHAGFVERALQAPDAPAVFAPERTLSYGELLAEACAAADWLIDQGVRPGEPVAVLMRKGWEQVVAVYGVLLAGGAYLPVDADLPTRRQLDLLRIGEAAQVLTQPGVLREEVAAAGYPTHEVRAGARGRYGPAHARSLEAPLDELAYVIFTSGTTGVPKGVMIDHGAVVNTNEHVNRLFGVGPADRVLGVSSLSFDLSVYDIFGLHDAGGALVLPDHRKGHDPVHWRELIARHGVTLWNSAPQLMRMLMDSFLGGESEPATLRTVLLSGDFISLDLPDRIRVRYPRAQVVSLGGATEASIWSIYHPVGAVDPAWASIPYGRPLPNQEIWVLDHAYRPCPDHVRGRIHIGGIGLAMGYWRDAEKTAARFVTHPETGARLYDTGDLGRYAPDGSVVILGRDDGQVKIRGHRIELGEIEAVLRQHPELREAVVLATAGPAEGRQLAAYVEPAAGFMPDPQALRDHLGERLPDYMVPRHVVVMERIPVSANGKIDHRALPEIAEEAGEGRAERVLPRTAAEQAVLDAWCGVIAGVEIGVTDNFFELGGDSVLATQLVRELNAALPGFELEMHELFECLTVEALAALYESRVGGTAAASGSGADEDEAVLADVRAAAERIAALDFAPPA
ncbi:MAG TPA: amino acid adenylation domain-containing protein, partial [Longimicrobiaceae bacterium]|nr:amino acid adenylation domain-containing protein [Longimicrobiaceae bacterium]